MQKKPIISLVITFVSYLEASVLKFVCIQTSICYLQTLDRRGVGVGVGAGAKKPPTKNTKKKKKEMSQQFG